MNVSLYFVVFREAKLYADMGLQVIYFVLSLYGWYEWLYRRNENRIGAHRLAAPNPENGAHA